MNSAQRVAVLLAQHFPPLDAGLLASRAAFRAALVDVLRFMGEDAAVAEIVALGPLAGARSPCAVLISRLRDLPGLVGERTRLVDEAEEAQRWRRLGVAARRGETLRALVESGDVFDDEAIGMVEREFGDDAEVWAVADAALRGGRP